MRKLFKNFSTALAIVAMSFGVAVAANTQSEVVGAKALAANFNFANATQRTQLDTSSQTWVAGDITMLVEKNTSTTNVADYTNPVRIYASHKVTFSGASNVASIESIAIVANSASYANVVGTSTFTGATASVSEANVTITASPSTKVVSFVAGKQTRFNTLAVNYTLDASGPVLTSIIVTTPPTKTNYYDGDTFDKAGMVVMANYDTGSPVDVTADVTVSPAVLETGMTSVELSLLQGGVEKKTTTPITVSAIVTNGIAIKTQPDQKVFALGERFNYSGLEVTVDRNNGSEDVTAFTVSEVDTMVLGTHEVIVSFEGKTVVYSVKVTNEGANVGGMSLTTDLFISEYIEGATGNDKVIEIFNGTGAPILLTDVYSLKVNANGGAAWGAAMPLTGTISNNGTWVYAHSGANATLLAKANQTSTSLTPNGNDAIGLFKNDILIDVIGHFGVNVTTGWDVDGVTNATKDHVIIRKPAVLSPSATWIVEDWAVASDVTNDSPLLGSHVISSADLTPTQQAMAFAHYVMTEGEDAEGVCLEKFVSLKVEFDFMDADAKIAFMAFEADESLSAPVEQQAKARYVYLQAYSLAHGGSGVRQPVTSAARNNMIAVISIGAIGLTSILGYYFINKKKSLG